MNVIYPGHRYALANLKGEGETVLQFAQDAPLHPVIGGPSCQEVLRALIDRVQVLDAEMPWPGNAEIVRDLRRALAGFEARAIIRKVEKGLAIEALPVAGDGHIALAQGMSAGTAKTPKAVEGDSPPARSRRDAPKLHKEIRDMTTDTTPTHSTAAFCNKCGFFGVPQSGGYHLRPRDGEPCNYEASIASVRQAPAPDAVELLRKYGKCLSCEGKGRCPCMINGEPANPICLTCCGDGLAADVRAHLGLKRPKHPNPNIDTFLSRQTKETE